MMGTCGIAGSERTLPVVLCTMFCVNEAWTLRFLDCLCSLEAGMICLEGPDQYLRRRPA